MRDEDDGPPLARHQPKGLEEVVGLLGSQLRGRLVQDEDAGSAVEGLEDLHSLLLTNGQLPDAGTRVDRHPVPLRKVRNPTFDHARLQQEPAVRGIAMPQHQVLGDGEGSRQSEMLVDHPNSGLDSVARRLEHHRLTAE